MMPRREPVVNDLDGRDKPVADRLNANVSLLLLAGFTAGGILMMAFLGSLGAIGNSDNAAILQNHISATIWATCVAKDNHHVAEVSYFSVVCLKPDPRVTEVQYSTFHDARATVNQLEYDMHKQSIPAEASSPRCGTRAPRAVSRWWMFERENTSKPVHTIVGTGPRPGSETVTRGWVLCYQDEGVAHVEWFDSDTHIFAWATGPEAAGLFAWWSTQAGPIHPAMKDMPG
jgi:hypothetical protein